MPLFRFGMYAGLVVCYWAVTLGILFALGPVFFFFFFSLVIWGTR